LCWTSGWSTTQTRPVFTAGAPRGAAASHTRG
jgi:hypothetical protein